MTRRLYDLTVGVALVTLNRAGPDADFAAHWRGRALACCGVKRALRAGFDARFRGV